MAAALLALSLTLAAPAQDEEPTDADDATTEEEITADDEADADDDSADADDSTDESTTSTDTPADGDSTTEADTPDTPEPAATAQDDTEDTDTPRRKKAPSNPRRAASFSDALQAAGEDGVAVYCYGPNWNRRSLNMLSDFWKTPELEAATGSAILVAVPYFEDPTEEQREKTQNAAAGMSGPPSGICPTVMLFDKNGTKYANLVGADDLGTENDSFATGLKNLSTKIDALHKRDAILQQAASMPAGVEKAKLLNQITDLPIIPPSGLVEMIREADPDDHSGMVRRNTFSALAFLYEQMHTKDGFLSPDFDEDLQSIKEACLKVAKDETLKPLDRQAAYLLLIGSSRRHEVTGIPLKQLITACAKIDPNSKYGRLATFLSEKWATMKYTASADERRNKRAQERKKDKDRKNKEKDEKRANKTTEVR